MKVTVKKFDEAYDLIAELTPKGNTISVKLVWWPPKRTRKYELSFKPSEESDEMKERWKNRFIGALLDLNGYQGQYNVLSVITESAWEREMLIDELIACEKGVSGMKFNAESQLCSTCIGEIIVGAVFDEQIVNAVRSKT